MNTINELLERIDKHKGVFDPSKEKYLDWVFRYNCRFMELYDLHPASHPRILENLMLERVNETLLHVKSQYWKTTQFTVIYVPSVESIDTLIEYDIKKRGLTLFLEDSQHDNKKTI